jgi:hypothetical protein
MDEYTQDQIDAAEFALEYEAWLSHLDRIDAAQADRREEECPGTYPSPKAA